MTLRKLSFLMLALFVIAAAVACTLNTGDTQTVLNNSNSPSGVTPSPGSSPLPQDCLPIERVSVGLLGQGGATTIRVNSDEKLDATPRDARGEAPYECHGHTVLWELSGSALCNPINDTGFTPTLRCSMPGSITVKATVSSPGGTGAVTLTVVP